MLPKPPNGSAHERPDSYFIEAAARILDVLELFRNREELRLTDVTQELDLIKSTAFRLLYTLERKGYIERIPDGKAWRRRQRYRVGFVSISASIPFVSEIERGIEVEARRSAVELFLRRHEFDSSRLVAAVESLIADGVSLLIIYNPDEHISHVVADRCATARIPIIAITFPVPGARLFGVNNYRAGLAGGDGLGEQISRRWSDDIDKVVILDIPGSSPAQQARVTGMVEGLRRHVDVPAASVIHLHTDRNQRSPEALIKAVLEEHRKARRIAILCYNDLNALGALKAVQGAGRADNVAILSQGGVAEVREQVRKARSPLWGAVAHFPERFGRGVVPLALKVLHGEPVPNTTYTEAVMLTRSNIDRYYIDK